MIDRDLYVTKYLGYAVEDRDRICVKVGPGRVDLTIPLARLLIVELQEAVKWLGKSS